MAKIQSVDYNQIPLITRKMRALGSELNNELKTVYKNITEMHNVWYGTRYQSLVLDFNAMVPQLNDMLVLVIGDIPFMLDRIANNYATVDTGNRIVAEEQTAPDSISDITVPADVGMRFLTSEVSAIQQEVAMRFNNSVDIMNGIEAELNKIEWESEAAESFREKFRSLKGNITASIDNIRSEFVKLMQQAQDDIQNAETANTAQ